MRSFIRPLISVLLVALTVLGLMNVYADNEEELRLAAEVACGPKLCDTHLVQLQRSVLAQTFTFQTSPKDRKTESESQVVTVECKRELIFAGGYVCRAQ
jgi:hypothetical protein